MQLVVKEMNFSWKNLICLVKSDFKTISEFTLIIRLR